MSQHGQFIITAVLLLCTISACLFSSCGENGVLYPTEILDVSKGGPVPTPECTYWNGAYFTDDAAQDATVCFDGTEFSGMYQESTVNRYNSFVTDLYLTDAGMQFGIRKDTKQPVLLNCMTNSFFVSESLAADAEDIQNTVIACADRILAGLVAAPETYERLMEYPKTVYRTVNGEEYSITYHTVTFARAYAGCNSSDYVSVRVTTKGHIASVVVGDLDAFEGRDTAFDQNEVRKCAAARAALACRDAGWKVTNTEVSDLKLAVNPDGELCVCSSVRVWAEDAEGKETQTVLTVLSIVG